MVKIPNFLQEVVISSLELCGPDLLHFLWNLADHSAQTIFGFSLDENTPIPTAPFKQQAANHSKLQYQKYTEIRILTCRHSHLNQRHSHLYLLHNFQVDL